MVIISGLMSTIYGVNKKHNEYNCLVFARFGIACIPPAKGN